MREPTCFRINYVPDHDIDFAFQAVYYDYSCFVGREEEPRTHQLHAIIYLVLANGALFDPSYPSGVSERRMILLPRSMLKCHGASGSRGR
jgi:hypothetical protein